MLTTYTNYQLITKDITKSLARTASDPVVARETKYYQDNIGNVKSIDDLLKNTRLLTYALKAYGLEDMAYAKGLIRKALTEGVDDKTSFANRLQDERYQEFVKVFNFKRYGEGTTAFNAVTKDTVDNYIRQTLETKAGEDDQGVRLALYFERKASGINSAFDILADPALQEVVTTAFNIPDEVAGSDIDAQAALIERKLDIKSLQDPAEVQKLVKRFTTMWDVANNTASDPVLALFNTSSASSGISIDSIVALQRIKSGG